MSSSSTILSSTPVAAAVLPFWSANPPFTTLTNPAALAPPVSVLLNVNASPISYPVPALSITISVIEPGPISST